jgi:hypothetical protein
MALTAPVFALVERRIRSVQSCLGPGSSLQQKSSRCGASQGPCGARMCMRESAEPKGLGNVDRAATLS